MTTVHQRKAKQINHKSMPTTLGFQFSIANGRYEEAAYSLYRQVLYHKNIEDRVKGIKHLLQTTFHGHSDSNHLIEYVLMRCISTFKKLYNVVRLNT